MSSYFQLKLAVFGTSSYCISIFTGKDNKFCPYLTYHKSPHSIHLKHYRNLALKHNTEDVRWNMQLILHNIFTHITDSFINLQLFIASCLKSYRCRPTPEECKCSPLTDSLWALHSFSLNRALWLQLAGVPGVAQVDKKITIHFACPFSSNQVLSASLEKVWSDMTPNILTETRCH